MSKIAHETSRKRNGHDESVRRLLAPILFLGSILGITVRQEKKRLVLGFAQRLIAAAFIVLTFIHEIPSMKYWMAHSDGHDFVWPNDNYRFFTSTLYALMDFIIVFPFFQFLHFVNIIRKFFQEMNASLKRLKKAAVKFENNPDKFLSGLRSEIIRLRETHFLLSKTCTELNSCFSTQLLFIISVSMIQLIYAMRSIMGNNSLPDVEERFFNLACDVTWFVTFCLFIIQMVAFSDKTSSEGKDAVVLAHHLMNVYYNDYDVIKELEFFVLQIKHHAGVFSIVFFDLDYPFLCTVISSLTTYFIVIVTFQGELDEGKPVEWNFKPPSTTTAEPISTNSTQLSFLRSRFN